MFGQKNYNEKLGISGKYRIAQAGCFLVAFSNLLERFNESVDPITLNNEFANRGIFVDVDDGVRDDLGYTSITQYKPDIVVVEKGRGAPTDSNTIVKFNYKSNGGIFANHFSLVHDASQGLIVDSWDGQVKSWNTYGGPVEWARYIDNTPSSAPIVVAPVATSPAYDGNQITILLGWGLSHAARNAGFSDWDQESRWTSIASLNGSNDWRAFNASLYPGQRINIGSVPQASPAPSNDIELVTVLKGWGLSTVAKQAGFPDWENPARWSEIARLNGSDNWQNFNAGLSVGQIVRVRGYIAPPAPAEALQPEQTPAQPEVVTPQITEPPIANVPDTLYRDTFKADQKTFISVATLEIKDLDEINDPLELRINQKVSSAGTFTKDGQLYAISRKHHASGKWYGIPMSVLKDESGKRYIGPLDINVTDSDLMDIDLRLEAKEALSNLNLRERLVVLWGKTLYFLSRFKRK